MSKYDIKACVNELKEANEYMFLKFQSKPIRSCNCNACKLPFYVFHELMKKVKLNEICLEEESINDVTMVIDDVSKKFLLCMGHKCRVRCQQNVVSKIVKHKNDVIHIIIDFKMSFEATSSRESSIEHFGKIEIAWHGVLIIYFETTRERQEDGSYKDMEKKKKHMHKQNLGRW